MTKLKIRIFLRIRSYKIAPLHKPDHWWEDQIYNLCEYTKKNKRFSIIKR